MKLTKNFRGQVNPRSFGSKQVPIRAKHSSTVRLSRSYSLSNPRFDLNKKFKSAFPKPDPSLTRQLTSTKPFVTLSQPLVSTPKRSYSTSVKPPEPPISDHPEFVGSKKGTDQYPRTSVSLFGLIDIPWGVHKPDEARHIAHDDEGRYSGSGARFDTRAPEDMRQEKSGAFVGRGTSLNITEHQLGGYKRLQKSGLVSWSKTEQGTEPIKEIRTGGKPEGYTYYTDNLQRHNTFDVESFYKPSLLSADVSKQQEVVSTKVSLSDITKVDDHAKGETRLWPFTPRSDLDVNKSVIKWKE